VVGWGMLDLEAGRHYNNDPCFDLLVFRLCVIIGVLVFHAVLVFHVSLVAFFIVAGSAVND
jgi:hypothetical protein